MFSIVLALIVFLTPLAWSPGPGNMFFAANGARFGVRSTLPANVGYHLATWFVTVAVGFGFLAAITRAPSIFAALQIAGALYVLWLAWKLYRSGAGVGRQDARPAGFIDGALLLLLNPKAYLIMALMFSQFLAEEAGSVGLMVLLISTVFTLNNMVAFTTWAVLGDVLARNFRSKRFALRLNTGFAMMLAGVSIWMLAS